MEIKVSVMFESIDLSWLVKINLKKWTRDWSFLEWEDLSEKPSNPGATIILFLYFFFSFSLLYFLVQLLFYLLI